MKKRAIDIETHDEPQALKSGQEPMVVLETTDGKRGRTITLPGAMVICPVLHPSTVGKRVSAKQLGLSGRGKAVLVPMLQK